MTQRSVLMLALVQGLSVLAQNRLSGTLLDAEGRPLPFASVTLDDGHFTGQADAQGVYVLSGMLPGTHRLRAAAVGHLPLDTAVVLAAGANTVDLRLRASEHLLRDVEVSALRAGDRAPFARSLMTKEDIARVNTGVDLPYVLEQQPNVVSTSDGGTGIGYTYMRIRGTDATRTNITLNGVPFNDAESQGAFLVNMPDIATSAEDIEVQRGVGTSTNGPAAFGATVNIRTTAVRRAAWGQAAISGGSFNTRRISTSAGTGLLNDRFSLDVRLSSIASDGYIDRATADLQSYFVQAAWVGAKRALRLVHFRGREVTYQAWAGVPREVIDTNRTFNPYTYRNEVDNYDQSHYQLLFDQQLGRDATLNITLFRVDGSGYFEQFREGDDLATYGIVPAVIDGDTVTTTDIVRRRWLDNTLLGANASVDVRLGAHRLVMGGSSSVYSGDHFGEVIWARYAGALGIGDRYYTNDARKTDANAFAKLTYALNDRLDVFGDAQVRTVAHTFLGYDNELDRLDRTVRFTFFNPKAGLLWRVHEGGRLYTSVAVAHREPNREDLVESTPAGQPGAERLTDLEAGYERRGARLAGGINAYYMHYQDQLVLTGELNDVGAALRTNVPRSYRAGVELSAAWRCTRRLLWRPNLALSRNRVLGFREYVDDWDTGGQQVFDLGERDLAFSPEVVGGSEFTFTCLDNATVRTDVTLVTKYVGAQYLDNTASVDRRLDPFLVNDVRVNATLHRVKGTRGIDLNITVRNVFSELYESNGWAYSFISGGRREALVGLFPQAPLNVLGGVTVRF